MSGARWSCANSRETKRRTAFYSLLPTDINGGRIKQLFILGGDPVYNAPRSLTQEPVDKEKKESGTKLLDWADLQKKVPEVVRLGYHEDATSALRPLALAGCAFPRIVGRRAHFPLALTCRSNR